MSIGGACGLVARVAGAGNASPGHRATLHDTLGAAPRRSAAQGGEFMDTGSEERELKALMLAGLDGHATAYRALLARLSGHLRGYFKRQLIWIGRTPADAEDLLQETLIALHTRRNTYDRTQLLTPWIYAIARYRLIDFLRRVKASTEDLPIEDAPELLVVDDSAAVDSRLDLQKLMAHLAPKTRQAIQMVKVEGLSVSEASRRSGMSESAIKVSVHRGLKALSLIVGRGVSHEDR